MGLINMLLSENSNKIGILGSLAFAVFNFICPLLVLAIAVLTSSSLNWFGYSILFIMGTIINIVLLIAFAKDFWYQRSLITLAICGIFALYTLNFVLYYILNWFNAFNLNSLATAYWTGLRFLSLPFLITILLSIRLFRNNIGFARLIGLGGIFYSLLNVVLSFIAFPGTIVFNILLVVWNVVPSVILLSYFFFFFFDD